MIRYRSEGGYVYDSRRIEPYSMEGKTKPEAARGTITYKILKEHNTGGDDKSLRITFDSLASHDITYVSVIQTLRAASPGLDRFLLPFVLSNCHNSLCAVGGTINADDHAFGLSAAKKYGGIFVPPHIAVIHQYMREQMAGCGKMILGSDSHTRYGALGTMGFGEGGGELVKQLLNRTYDIPYPGVVGVKLTGEPLPWVGPQDVALALINFVFEKGLVKNKVLEFFGEGLARLSMDYRNGIDVMTTETACLSSIWVTDEKLKEFYALHGREEAYRELKPEQGAFYDAILEIDLSKIKPMIALPFHPSNALPIEEAEKNPLDVSKEFCLKDNLENGKVKFGQGIIVGCAGGLYENIQSAAAILKGKHIGNGPFTLSVYPASQPIYLSLAENGIISDLTRSGAVIRTAFCGPCFGAGEVPANKGLSARHATRNFPNREGSKPDNGQNAAVALMDARSIAATAANKGILTAASEADINKGSKPYFFEKTIYSQSVYDGFEKPDASQELVRGPGIRDWPPLKPLEDNLLLLVASFITDPVTTTDELIPSGEASSFRSNPFALAEFTLSRKDPGYVERAKSVNLPEPKRIAEIIFNMRNHLPIDKKKIGCGSLVYANKPGDGSAREQAASCQRVLGGLANISREYATKRYRSNLVNWGMLPFIIEETPLFETGDWIYIPDIKEILLQAKSGTAASVSVKVYMVKENADTPPLPFTLSLPGLTEQEAEIILHGGLINYYKFPPLQ